MNGKIEITRGIAADLTMDLVTQDDYERRVAAREELRALLAAPVVERQPVSADIVHDKAYRNGMMAGFSFGIRGDEDGYAKAVERYDAEIHAAKAEQPAPVAVLPSLWEMRVRDEPDNPESTCEYVYVSSIMERDSILRRGGASVFAEYACLDKVKELNQ
jgi:hypothetical protein